MGRIAFPLFLLLLTQAVWAQTLVNNGDVITVQPGALIYVDGVISLANDGEFDNSGEIRLTSHWFNNNPTFGGNTLPRNGQVTFDGGLQRIGGTQVTTFNNVVLNNGSVKILENDAIIDTLNTILLNDSELRTESNSLFVNNPDPVAIGRINGFVSSGDGGRLVRLTNQGALYLFPVGDAQLGPTRYRPVFITPNQSVPGQFHVYAVRFVNQDPSLPGPDGGFNRLQLDTILCEVNTYYHLVERRAGPGLGVDPADLQFTFLDNESITDTMANWNDAVPQWAPIGPLTVNRVASPALSTMTVAAWDDYVPGAFAMANIAPVAGFNVNPTPTTAQTPILFSPTQQGGNFIYTWDFGDGNLSTDRAPTHAYNLPGTYTVRFTITTPSGTCTDFFERVVNIEPLKAVYFPNAFSPNATGDNESFVVTYYGYQRSEMQIYNRWGNKVAELSSSQSPIAWNGLTDGGSSCPEGVYVFRLKLFNDTTGATDERVGSITLIR